MISLLDSSSPSNCSELKNNNKDSKQRIWQAANHLPRLLNISHFDLSWPLVACMFDSCHLNCIQYSSQQILDLWAWLCLILVSLSLLFAWYLNYCGTHWSFFNDIHIRPAECIAFLLDYNAFFVYHLFSFDKNYIIYLFVHYPGV